MNSSQTIYGILDRDQLNESASDFYQELTLKTNLRNLCIENPGKAQTRLALFFTQAVGGAQIYSDQRSHATVRIHHFKWKINTQIRDLCSEAMAALMKRQSLDPTPKATLSGYFTHTGQYMSNHE